MSSLNGVADGIGRRAARQDVLITIPLLAGADAGTIVQRADAFQWSSQSIVTPSSALALTSRHPYVRSSQKPLASGVGLALPRRSRVRSQ